MSLVVKIDAIAGAADAYSKACKAYESALALVLDALQKNLTWDDAAHQKWDEETDAAIKQLNLVKTKLANNQTVLNAMKNAAYEAQKATVDGIGTILG